MASTTTMETTALAAFTLPGSPHSARMARFYIRAALTYHGLGSYADDAETVASELIANAVTHAPAPVVTLALTWLERSRALGIVVTDSSPLPPVKRDPGKDNEHGRGLQIVEALSARWGWQPRDPGKAVYAILAREA
jgi:anti-sigma regulatory factor (Ser/Thr protein kinase)